MNKSEAKAKAFRAAVKDKDQLGPLVVYKDDFHDYVDPGNGFFFTSFEGFCQSAGIRLSDVVAVYFRCKECDAVREALLSSDWWKVSNLQICEACKRK